MWTRADEAYLRRLRIASDHPPEALPRFFVEPLLDDGEYGVLDRLNKFRVAFIYPPQWPDPRAEAEACASALNAKHLAEITNGRTDSGT